MNTKNWMVTAVAVLALAAGTARPATAGFIPVGVQDDVPLATVTGAWEWSILYQGGYGESGVDFANIVSALNPGDYIMLAGMQDGSGILDVLSAATVAEVTTVTASNVTHAANGSEWYYNGSSMGFAPLGSVISQNSADTLDAPGFGGNPAVGALRLSWHTNGVAGILDGGWRSGNTTFLNSEPTGWDRLVLVYSPNAVPEPASLTMCGIAAATAGLFGWRRRRSSRS